MPEILATVVHRQLQRASDGVQPKQRDTHIMPPVASITLADLKILPHWRDASPGALVQATAVTAAAPEFVLVGMRCEMGDAKVPRPCLLVLDGDERGRFFEANALRDTALDVSDLLEIRVRDPRPRQLQYTDHSLFGVVCDVGSGCLVVRARLPEERGACFVYLTAVKGVPAGTVANELFSDLCVIGESEVAVREPRPGAATPPDS
jgi:hypothetical protein